MAVPVESGNDFSYVRGLVLHPVKAPLHPPYHGPKSEMKKIVVQRRRCPGLTTGKGRP